jgi:tetratricopeptide (TPR) repeat protein
VPIDHGCGNFSAVETRPHPARRWVGSRTDPSDSRLKHGAGLLARHKPETAEQVFRTVLDEFPDSAVANAMLAMALADQGRGRDALFSADFAIGRDPGLALGHAARACALETMGLSWEAEMESRQAVALAPTDPNRHSDLAGIVGRAGRYHEALDITGKGLSLNPQHLPSIHCRALALVSLGRTDDAESVLASALLEDLDLAQLRASVGLALESKGDRAGAAVQYREALRLDPATVSAREGLRRLEGRYSKLIPARLRRKKA